jgi:hypothetical protein
MWRKNGDLACDTCDVVLEYPGPRRIVLNAARAHNWHCFTGTSITGNSIETHICPGCIGTNRSTVKSNAKPLTEDQPLF